jgi:hypothetical protein
VPQALQTPRSTLSGRLIPFSDEICSKRVARCADTEGEVVARRCDAAQRWRSCRAVVEFEVIAGRRCGDWVVTWVRVVGGAGAVREGDKIGRLLRECNDM